MPETVLILAGGVFESSRWAERHLKPDDKPIFAEAAHHFTGVRPDRVVRLPGFFRRPDREYLEREAIRVEQACGL